MSVECKSSGQNNGEVSLESYRCNSCSIDFNIVEHLIEHTQEVHTDPDRGVTCGKCQVGFAEISEFIEHHRSVHLKNDCVSDDNEVHVDLGDEVKCETLTLNSTSADGESDNIDDAIPEQITIVNDSGETIGIAECDEDQVGAITVTHDVDHDLSTSSAHISTFTSFQNNNSRKRRLPAKLRDLLTEPEQSWKRVAESSLTPPEKRDELEIDVSGLSGIRLKTRTGSREEEIINYLIRVEEKLDCIIKHFNVPLNTEQTQRINPFTNLTSKSAFRKSVPQRSLVHEPTIANNNITTSLNVVTPRRQTSTNGRQNHDVGYISCEPPPTLPEVTQYVISDDLLEAVYMKSRNRGNFAKHLVFAAFPLEERLGRNCYGRRGGSVSGPKDPLEHAKLEAVREAVFKKFPVLDGDDIDAVWKRECVIAIDTALRSEMRTRILNMQNNIKHEIMQNSIKSEMKNNIAMNVTM